VTLVGGVVGVLVPWALAVQVLIQILLVKRGALSGLIRHGDSVFGVVFAVLVLQRLRTVVVLVGAVSRRAAIMAWAVVLPPLRMVVSVTPVLVVAVGFFSILHVGVLVDNRHHL
jgi:hypothetical protein